MGLYPIFFSPKGCPVTTGYQATGPKGLTSQIHSAKSWTGADGKTIPGRVSRKQQWNAYLMAHQKFSSSNPNRIGTVDPNPPYTYTERDNHDWSNVYYGVYGDGTISTIFPTSRFNEIWTANEELELLAKLANKVKGHSYDMGVSLAEVDKLAGTILGTVKTLALGVYDLTKGPKGIRSFARRFGTSPPSTKEVRRLMTKDISGRFLEMRYAWTPAIGDAYEAAKAFEALSNGPRQVVFKKTRRKTDTIEVDTNYSRINVVRTAQKTYSYEMYEEMSAFRQMGLMNPTTIIWERIPWSFVIDWFIPIGTYLSVIGQIPFMNGRWMVSRSLTQRFNGKVAAIQSVGGWNPSDPYPNANGMIFNLERTIPGSPPTVPLPSFHVEGAVQGRRVGNALALAHQLFVRAGNLPLNKGSRSKGAVQKVNALKAIAYQLGRI